MGLVAEVPIAGAFLAGDSVSSVVSGAEARALFARVSDQRAVVLLVEPSSPVSLKLAAGWAELRRAGVPGVHAVIAERTSPR